MILGILDFFENFHFFFQKDSIFFFEMSSKFFVVHMKDAEFHVLSIAHGFKAIWDL